MGSTKKPQKLLLVDDVAYIGSLNTNNDYAGVDIGGTGRFRDTNCLITGPVIPHLVNSFLRVVRTHSPSLLAELTEWCKNNKTQFVYHPEGVMAQVVESNIPDRRRTLQKSIIIAIKSAQSYCYIVSPYFLPPRPLKQAILRAKKKGVSVKILTDILINKTPVINHAMMHCVGSFMKEGIEVYQHSPVELHSKILMVDGQFLSMGSFNFDGLSFSRNLELNLNIEDKVYTKKLEDRFIEDLKSARKLTLAEWESRPWWSRAVDWVCYGLCRLL